MDKTVIADLPHKTEIKVFCPLSRHQAALREHAVKELTEQLAAATRSRSLGRRRQRRMDPSA
jgi:non-specific serine/threonine protein kinase